MAIPGWTVINMKTFLILIEFTRKLQLPEKCVFSTRNHSFIPKLTLNVFPKNQNVFLSFIALFTLSLILYFSLLCFHHCYSLLISIHMLLTMIISILIGIILFRSGSLNMSFRAVLAVSCERFWPV